MANIYSDDSTPLRGTRIRANHDLNRTTQVLNLRAADALSADCKSAGGVAALDKVLLDIEQNRFAFITSRDPDAAIHDLFNRVEEMAVLIREFVGQLQVGAKSN